MTPLLVVSALPAPRKAVSPHGRRILALLLACASHGALADEALPRVDGAPPPGYAMVIESALIAQQDQKVDVYRPLVEPALGVAIVAHGFGGSRGRHREIGKALASAGVTAIVPDLPNLMNLWGNGDAIVELAHQLEAGALGLPPVLRRNIVLIGTSAGGLATVLAAAKLPGLAGWVGLDPVDRTGTGIAAAEKLASPAVVLLAEPTGCNLFGSGRSLARAAANLRHSTVFPGSSHCDFEDPTNNFCKAVCGRSSPEMQARIRAEAVDAAVLFLTRPGEPRTREADASE